MDTITCYGFLANFIEARKKADRPLIVGINGVDGSGKTTFAENMAEVLEERGHDVCRISIDNFHHPRQHRHRRGSESPEAFYLDSMNYEVFADKALRPAFDMQKNTVSCQTKLFDLATDKEDARFQKINRNTIILAEGVFLFRPEIAPLLHIKIFIHADFKTILDRVKVRDAHLMGSPEQVRARYERKYIPGQELYFKDVNPANLADVIVDNNDFENPEIIMMG